MDSEYNEEYNQLYFTTMHNTSYNYYNTQNMADGQRGRTMNKKENSNPCYYQDRSKIREIDNNTNRRYAQERMGDAGTSIEELESDEPVLSVREEFDEQFLKQTNAKHVRDDSLNFNMDANNLNAHLYSEKDMFHPYDSTFVSDLLHNKHIALIGDSLTRGIYKDLLNLIRTNGLCPPHVLKDKVENSVFNDRQIDIESFENDKIFRQAREYCSETHLIQYLFTTRVMKDDVEKFLMNIRKSDEYPDVIIINSALWDLTRYYENHVNMLDVDPYEENPRGQLDDETNSMNEYTERISILMRRLRLILPPSTQVIWLLMPWPIVEAVNLEYLSAMLKRNYKQRNLYRSIYNDGNYRAAQIVANAGYDVLDIGFYMRAHNMYPLRVQDGVHWGTIGTRFMTQLIIGHLAKNITLPNEVEKNINKCIQKCSAPGNTIENISKNYLEQMDRLVTSEKNNPQTGPWFNSLQRNLSSEVFRKLPPKLKDAISNDIMYYRVSELIRTRRLKLEETDEVILEDQAESMPNIKEMLPIDEYHEQLIKVSHPRANPKR